MSQKINLFPRRKIQSRSLFKSFSAAFTFLFILINSATFFFVEKDFFKGIGFQGYLIMVCSASTIALINEFRLLRNYNRRFSTIALQLVLTEEGWNFKIIAPRDMKISIFTTKLIEELKNITPETTLAKIHDFYDWSLQVEHNGEFYITDENRTLEEAKLQKGNIIRLQGHVKENKVEILMLKQTKLTPVLSLKDQEAPKLLLAKNPKD